TMGAVGHGIDLNPQRIAEAEQNAKDQGVSNRVIFLEGDLFEAVMSQASVVTMYLLSSVNLRLRPRLLKELKPGTRIVSHGFSMGEWEPDQQARIDNRSVYFWVIPARVEGTWNWTTQGESFSMNAGQEFQKIHLELQNGSNTLAVRDPVLHGERICFTARNSANGNHYVFNGRVEGNIITGTAQIRNGESGTIVPWSATFTGR
ncbi:MAG: class I SAM-dependent methyltransferase, partial [Bacteroidales bacterium]